MPKQWIYRSRLGSFSLPVSSLLMLMGLLILTAFISMLSLSAGSTWLLPSEVINALMHSSSQAQSLVVETLRLPRVIMGLMVGAGLGCSGLILQSVIRNPLASPDVVGITSGASAAAVCFLSFFQLSLSMAWLPLFAIIGAVFAASLVYLLAWRGGVTPMRMILVGIGISAAMSAVTTFMLATGSVSGSLAAYIWLTGSIYGANWQDVQALLPWLLLSLPCALLFTRSINAQELGDNIATGLGISIQKLRMILVALSVLLAAPVVAYAGAVGFVGLIAPHIARRLVTRGFGLLMPASALVGGILVVLADLCARMLFQPLDIPAGVFVSAIGAPFFLYLLFRQRF